jgi:hypothetical protein
MENRRKPAPRAATLDINCDCKEACNVELNITHIRGGQIDLERFAFLIGEVGEAAVEHGFGGRDELDYNSVAVGKCRIDRRQQAWQLHREKELREEALLGAFETSTAQPTWRPS